MKLWQKNCLAALVLTMSVGFVTDVTAAGRESKKVISYNWKSTPVEYKNFTDVGHYMLEVKGLSVADIDRALVTTAKLNDGYRTNGCSGTIKKNNKNEVLMSHSMDMDISQTPGFLARITDGKYDTVLLTYIGAQGRYKYNAKELAALDKDEEYLKAMPFNATDVMNEKGLYMCVDMRCGDANSQMDCPGTNPGKPRASALMAPALVSLNCATVKEALQFLQNSYDWYTVFFSYPNGDSFRWSMAFLIGDATGEYGLVEFGRNGVYFTPYQNFQSNYYIHPLLSERATINHGHGRAAALLQGLMDVQTEKDIYENQKKARYTHQLLNPSWKYYSDAQSLSDVNVRRTMPAEQQAAIYHKELIQAGGFKDNIEKLKAYHEGKEEALRNDANLWMGSITSGVNCAKKRAMIEMWENGTVINIKW